MFYLSVGIIVVASTAYHLSQKATPHSLHPVIALLVTYGVAFLASLLLFFIYPLTATPRAELNRITPASVALGFAIVGIELGFLLAYRAGWNVSLASLVANLLVALVLVAAGISLFKEQLSLVNIAGIALCVVGLILVSR